MASKQKVKVTTKTTTTTTKKRVAKTGGNSGYKQCNICKGTGRVKA